MELGSTVTLAYRGYTEDGVEFGYADAEKPMEFQTGMDMVIDGLEKEVLLMNEVGEKRTFTVSQYDAYGEYLDDFFEVVPLMYVPKRNVKVGQRIWMQDSDEEAPMLCTVVKIEDGNVTFDMNHPLAGKDLTFEVEILAIEEPPENFVSAREKAEHLKEQGKLLGGEQGESYR